MAVTSECVAIAFVAVVVVRVAFFFCALRCARVWVRAFFLLVFPPAQLIVRVLSVSGFFFRRFLAEVSGTAYVKSRTLRADQKRFIEPSTLAKLRQLVGDKIVTKVVGPNEVCVGAFLCQRLFPGCVVVAHSLTHSRTHLHAHTY
jgi:hypothetical protein